MKAVFVIFLGIFAFIGLTVISQKGVNYTSKITPTPTFYQERLDATTKTSSIELKSGEAAYYLIPQEANVNKGENLKIIVMLKSQDLTLSAGAMRINMTLDNDLKVSISDSDKTKVGIQVDTNSEIKARGFSFPINEAEVVNAENRGRVDLALVNLNPEGFRAEEDISMATIEFIAESPGFLTLEFDKNLTKLVNKKGEEVPLNLVGGVYVMK